MVFNSESSIGAVSKKVLDGAESFSDLLDGDENDAVIVWAFLHAMGVRSLDGQKIGREYVFSFIGDDGIAKVVVYDLDKVAVTKDAGIEFERVFDLVFFLEKTWSLVINFDHDRRQRAIKKIMAQSGVSESQYKRFLSNWKVS